MYTFLRIDIIDFKNRMKLYDYYIYFLQGLDLSAAVEVTIYLQVYDGIVIDARPRRTCWLAMPSLRSLRAQSRYLILLFNLIRFLRYANASVEMTRILVDYKQYPVISTNAERSNHIEKGT